MLGYYSGPCQSLQGNHCSERVYPAIDPFEKADPLRFLA